MANCGEASAAFKFADQVFQDRSSHLARGFSNGTEEVGEGDEGAEFFEFRRPLAVNHADTRQENKQSQWAQDYIQERFSAEFDAAFQRAYRMSQQPINNSGCPWTSQFLAKPTTVKATSQGWISEFTANTSKNNTHSEWAHEFKVQDQVSSWIDEFKTQQASESLNEDMQMAVVAENLLESLEMSDPKLSNSKFVRFLQNLARKETQQFCPFVPSTQNTQPSDFQLWKEQYLKNIGHLRNEDSDLWETMEKGWERYQSNGYGYEKFAEQQFSNYLFSVPYGANPFKNRTDIEALVSTLKHDPKNSILCYESLVQQQPENAEAWIKLGLLQQQNEMDAQAIGALLKASKLGDTNAFIPLAASLTNESCIPEALDALESWILAVTAQSSIPSIQSPSRMAGLIREYSVAVETLGLETKLNAHIALSILFSMSGNYQQALESLEKALALKPNSVELLNRMGAVFANSQKYSEALALYDSALGFEPKCPRVHYNRGISLMCSKYHEEASKAFVQALKHQLPVDVVQGINPELVDRYMGIWDSLRSNLEFSGNYDERIKAALSSRDVAQLEALLRG